MTALSLGETSLPPGEVLAALLGRGDEQTGLLVLTFRLPRVAGAVIVGAAFGMAGALFQSLTRNPLGSPDVLGFNAGAAAGALLSIVVLREATFAVPVAALGGGLLTAAAAYALAWRGGVGVARLVLVGIGLNFVMAAIVDTLLLRADTVQAVRATVWLTGSLNDASWGHLMPALAGLAVLGPLALGLGPALDRMAMGEDAARGLGLRPGRVKAVTAATGVGLAALAVAATGPIAFVALVAGPVARRLCDSPGACVAPAALTGALLVLGADLAARLLLAPLILPVGVATALLGAPYLVWLLARQMRSGAL